MHKISVILNLYKRPHSLKEQYEAIRNQSVKPDEILIWRNDGSDLKEFDQNILKECKFVNCNNNDWGVWGRFALGLLSKGDYICWFDDDTIPGKNWLASCIEVQKQEPCVCGTVGVTFNSLHYDSYDRYGWCNPNEEIVQTDIAGHGWVTVREAIGEMWRSAHRPAHMLSGEDVHLSFAAQRLGMRTLIPPHPKNNLSVYGSIPKTAWEYGTEEHCISKNYHGTHFAQNLVDVYNKGFKFLRFA